MDPAYAILFLLSLLLGMLLSLLVWGFWKNRSQENSNLLQGARDDVLLGLMLIAVFALGIFVTYALFNLNF